ncbi:ribosome recycling factor [Hyphobacterium sp. CCMP332]|nr:ribosome recycling factor [Hyphobacterium sp. CCMP332]
MEEIEMILELTEESMDKAVAHTKSELAKIRAGKANPSILEGVMVEYYGAMTPLNQLASVNTPDARSFLIKPFEKSILADVERAIINSNLGLNPQNDGENIRINLPPLTEDRRIQLVKQAKSDCEQGKISIRTVRKDMNDELKKLQKDGAPEDLIKDAEGEVQKITDKHSEKLDEIFKVKEEEIMTI